MSEGGKLWSTKKETVKGVNLIENLNYEERERVNSELISFIG